MSDAIDDDKPTRRDFLYITTGAYMFSISESFKKWPFKATNPIS